MQTENRNSKIKKVPLNWILAVGVVLFFAINNLMESLIPLTGYINLFIYLACIVAAGISFVYLIKKFNLLNFVPLLLSLSPLAFALIVAFIYARGMSGF